MESLLAMICDSVFWLSAEGLNVSRSSPQFDAMMGRAMLHVDMSKMFADECATRLRLPPVPGTSPVGLQHTSLTLPSGQVAKIEMFTVDRRSTADASDKLG